MNIIPENEKRAYDQAGGQLSSIKEMIEALHAARKGNSIREFDEAQRTISEDALSVEVRSDWHAPGQTGAAIPGEYRICLCTGGPAVQIFGDLSEHSEPATVTLQYQDWFLPWKDYPLQDDDEAALLEYARQFYYGE